MKEILDVFSEDLRATEELINGNIYSTIKIIPELSNYIFESGGKRFRPLLVILSSSLCGYRGPRAHVAGCVAEYIHTATLLHDDVVDESDVRRGRASANSVWGNEASVLVGDFLFARSFQLMVKELDHESLEVMSRTCMHLAEGEILQLIKSFDVKSTIDDYYRIIFGKTAALISACCEVGALVAGERGKKRDALKRYGQELGYAFQIVDDCLDMRGNPEKTGKPLGNDLKEGKLTLPILLAMQRAEYKEVKLISEAILSEEFNEGHFLSVREVVGKYKGVEEALESAKGHIDRAISFLSPFERRREKGYLKRMAQYIVERER